jgi:hypothetical protein
MHHTSRTQDLELAIDDVVKSYAGPQEINNLESAALPNKRAVVDAYNHIKPVIYLGFYSMRSLQRENLRFAVSEHLYPAFEALVEQIDRALTYETGVGRASGGFPAGWAEEVVLRLFKALPEVRRIRGRDRLQLSGHRSAHRSPRGPRAVQRAGTDDSAHHRRVRPQPHRHRSASGR